MHSDIMNYPPMISLIDILKELGEDIVYIGAYSDTPTTRRFKEIGVEFVNIVRRKSDSKLSILKAMFDYRRKLASFLNSRNLSKDDILWYVFCDSAPAVYDIIAKHRYIVHYYEFDRLQFNWQFRILYPSFNHEKFAKGALTTIQCEYNRAQIFRGLLGLNYVPDIIPNKPYIKEGTMNVSTMPSDINILLDDLKDRTVGRKIVLYQGIFDSRERKLEEFCEAINIMPEDYMLIAMGKGDKSYEMLKNKYQSNRILFIPFIIPPYHLHVTKMSSVGVLSYSPVNKTINGVINPLYCAPNKIFEYTRYGKPMISNDIPGLKNIFDCYHCGEVVEYPLNPSKIVEILLQIFNSYEKYSEGAFNYYNSVDIKKSISNIIKKIEYNG